MTVHGNRPRCPEDRGSSRGRGPLLVNGERKIEGPMLENLSMSQSWNGYIWHLQQSPHEKKNQLTNGHNGLLQTYPVAGKPRTLDLGYSKRDSLVSRSRDSPVSVGSLDRPSSVDRLSNDRLSNDRLSSDRLSNDPEYVFPEKDRKLLKIKIKDAKRCLLAFFETKFWKLEQLRNQIENKAALRCILM